LRLEYEDLSIAKAIQVLKGNSSKWIHETFPKMRSFEWQQGYGAFSIGISAMDSTIAYICGKPTTIARDLFAKNSRQCCIDMALITGTQRSNDFFRPIWDSDAK
jgi:hypothetical protein